MSAGLPQAVHNSPEFRATEIASMAVWPAAVYFDWVARYARGLSLYCADSDISPEVLHSSVVRLLRCCNRSAVV